MKKWAMAFVVLLAACNEPQKVNLDSVDINAILEEAMPREQAYCGTIILMETETGRVRHCGYSTDSASEELYAGDIALDFNVSPGSLNTLSTSMALLDNGVWSDLVVNIESPDSVYRVGWINIKEDSDISGNINMYDAFRLGSNVFFTEIGYSTFAGNEEKYVDCLINDQHILEPMLDSIQMSESVLANYKRWNRHTLVNLLYGYNIEMSPVRILTQYNAIANDGVMVAPKLSNDEPTRIIGRKLCSKNTLYTIKEFLDDMNLQKVLGYDVYAKTGISRYSDYGLTYSKDYYWTACIAAYPKEDLRVTIYAGMLLNIKNTNNKMDNTVCIPVVKSVLDNFVAKE